MMIRLTVSNFIAAISLRRNTTQPFRCRKRITQGVIEYPRSNPSNLSNIERSAAITRKPFGFTAD